MRLLLVFILISSFAYAQKSEQQLAYQYYINGEYAKAITIYEELATERFSVAYYIPYFTSLLKTEDYKSAEKLARKIMRNSSLAISAAIRAINANFEDGINGYETEINEFGDCFGTQHFIEVTTAFLEKRKPDFYGK